MKISSLQNPKIKQLIKLQQKSRERKKSALFVVEGLQENYLAINNAYHPIQFFVCENIFNKKYALPEVEMYSVSAEIFQKIAYRPTTGGIIGVYKTSTKQLSELELTKNSFFIVLESVEKPGNLGAILRTADAANVSAVIVCDPLLDFYNPNVIRNSVGALFSQLLIKTEKETLIEFCKKNHIRILSTFLRNNTESIYEQDLTQSTALVFGTEATGLSDFWLEHSDTLIKIPMMGQVDSLNLSNTVAICAYEKIRQNLS